MVNTGELETYLNDKSCSEGDIVEILGEGVIELKEDENTKKVKKLLNLPVKLNGQLSLTYTPGKKALFELQYAWGKDTKKWVNKKFQIKFVLMQIGQNELKVIKPVPLAEEKK